MGCMCWGGGWCWQADNLEKSQQDQKAIMNTGKK